MNFLFDMFKEKKSFYKLVIWTFIICSLTLTIYYFSPNMRTLQDFYKFGLTGPYRMSANMAASLLILYIGTIILTGLTSLIAYKKVKEAKKNDCNTDYTRFFIVFSVFISFTLLIFILIIV